MMTLRALGLSLLVVTLRAASDPSTSKGQCDAQGRCDSPDDFSALQAQVQVAAGASNPHQGEAHETKKSHGVGTPVETVHEENLVGRVVATVLIGFVVFQMCIMYMLNYPDDQVQSYSFKMVAQCLSVLLAVLIQTAQTDFFVETVFFRGMLGSKHSHEPGAHADSGPEGHGHEHSQPRPEKFGDGWGEFLFCFLLFVLWFLAISCLSRWQRRSSEGLFAVSALVAHETAFVAIHTFGDMQEDMGLSHYADKPIHPGWGKGIVWIYALLPIVVLLALRSLSYISQWVRTRFLSDASEQAAVESHGHGEDWRDHAMEGEDEMCAIVVAYLLRQCTLFFVCGRVPHNEGDFGDHDQGMFGKFSLAIFIFMFLLTLVTRYVGNKHSSSDDDHMTEGHFRFCKFLQMLFAMAIAWHLLSLGRWCAQLFLHSSHALQFVSTAFVLSPLCVLVVILVDKLADKQCIFEGTAEIVIQSLGLLVGFAWEKAFHMSIHTMMGNLSAPEMYETAACLALVIVVLPAWRLLILPRAVLPVPERDWVAGEKARLHGMHGEEHASNVIRRLTGSRGAARASK